MQTAMTMNTLGLGLGARPVARSRVVGTKSAKAIVGTPVVGKPVQLATRRAAVTVRAGGNPEPIVQAPFVGIKEDLAARGPLYIDDFKQGISPKSLVRDHLLFLQAWPPNGNFFSRAIRAIDAVPQRTKRETPGTARNARPGSVPTDGRAYRALALDPAHARVGSPDSTSSRREEISTSKIRSHWELFFQKHRPVPAASLHSFIDPETDRCPPTPDIPP